MSSASVISYLFIHMYDVGLFILNFIYIFLCFTSFIWPLWLLSTATVALAVPGCYTAASVLHECSLLEEVCSQCFTKMMYY